MHISFSWREQLFDDYSNPDHAVYVACKHWEKMFGVLTSEDVNVIINKFLQYGNQEVGRLNPRTVIPIANNTRLRVKQREMDAQQQQQQQQQQQSQPQPQEHKFSIFESDSSDDESDGASSTVTEQLGQNQSLPNASKSKGNNNGGIYDTNSAFVQNLIHARQRANAKSQSKSGARGMYTLRRFIYFLLLFV